MCSRVTGSFGSRFNIASSNHLFPKIKGLVYISITIIIKLIPYILYNLHINPKSFITCVSILYGVLNRRIVAVREIELRVAVIYISDFVPEFLDMKILSTVLFSHMLILLIPSHLH